MGSMRDALGRGHLHLSVARSRIVIIVGIGLCAAAMTLAYCYPSMLPHREIGGDNVTELAVSMIRDALAVFLAGTMPPGPTVFCREYSISPSSIEHELVRPEREDGDWRIGEWFIRRKTPAACAADGREQTPMTFTATVSRLESVYICHDLVVTLEVDGHVCRVKDAAVYTDMVYMMPQPKTPRYTNAGNVGHADRPPKSFRVLKQVLQGVQKSVSIEHCEVWQSILPTELTGRSVETLCAMLEQHLDVALSSYANHTQTERPVGMRDLLLGRLVIRSTMGEASILLFPEMYAPETHGDTSTPLYRVACPGLGSILGFRAEKPPIDVENPWCAGTRPSSNIW